MDSVSRLVSSFLGANLEVVTLVMFYAAFTLLMLGVLHWLAGGLSPAQRRLRAISNAERRAVRAVHHDGEFNVKWLEPAARLILPKEGWLHSGLHKRLVQAGYRGTGTLYVFMLIKLVLAIVLPGILLIAISVTPFWPAGYRGLLMVLVVLLAGIGFALPDVVLENLIKERNRKFTESFPDALDMMVVCVEAGLGLDAAIQRVGDEIALAHPELASEFNLLSLELRAGKSREDALRSLAERIGIDSVRTLASVLIQAEHFGTSIGGALREHASEMRVKRIQIARERAAKLPVKLLFPIAFFIFPALFLIILGPASINIYRAFTTAFGG